MFVYSLLPAGVNTITYNTPDRKAIKPVKPICTVKYASTKAGAEAITAKSNRTAMYTKYDKDLQAYDACMQGSISFATARSKAKGTWNSTHILSR